MVDRNQPYKVSRFVVDLGKYKVADFEQVTLPNTSTEVNDYRTGADAALTRKLWGSTHHEDLVLVRGADDNTDLLDWRKLVNDGKIKEARVSTISVTLKSESMESGPTWVFTEAWPREYKPPKLSSDQHSVAKETVVIAFDTMKRDA